MLHHTIEPAQEGKDLGCDYRVLLPFGSLRYVSLRAHATRDSQGGLDYIGAVRA
jgi:hypothetical protein